MFLVGTMSLALGLIHGQQGDEGVSAEAFRALSEEIDYSRSKRKLVLRGGSQPREKMSDHTGPLIRAYNNLGVFQWIAFLLLAVVILFMLFTLFHHPQDGSDATAHLEKDEEDDMLVADADDAYLVALNQGDYRLAIRMQFIKVMQYLSSSSIIRWLPEKTNRQYLNEMTEGDIREAFRELSHIYEWVWYGNTAIQEEDFRIYSQPFMNFFDLTDQ